MSSIAAALAPIGRWIDRLFAPWNARLNPILVKEVRQALRGRYFTIVFWIMVALATVIGCMLLVEQGRKGDPDGGIVFFLAMYSCLSVAVHVFVPFSAFLSVGAEWDENTYDLLVLSNLGPYQIVFGKLLSACVQTLLFYCAFGPFLVFAFLLRGLDLLGAAWILGGTLVTSFGLISLALCFSSLVRHRFARVLMMALLAAALIWCTGGSILFSTTLFEERFLHTPEFPPAALTVLSAAAFVGFFSLAFAATRFMHVEENRSTLLRVLTTVLTLAGLGWMAYFYLTFKEPEILGVIGTMTLVAITLLGTTFVAEPEALGRRVRRQVPRNPVLALASLPFFPGGARGVVHYAFNALLLFAGGAALYLFAPPSSPLRDHWQVAPFLFFVYLLAYLAVPTAFLARWTGDLKVRILSRLLVPFVAAMGFVVPSILGFLFGSSEMMRGRHPGNPVWLVEEIVRDGRWGLALPAALFGLVTLVVNLPRLTKAIRETLTCSDQAPPVAGASASHAGPDA